MARIGATKNVKKQGLRALTLFLPIITLHLAGCATTTRTPLTYLGHYQIQAPKVDGFVACKSYGCKKKSWLTYTTEEWQEISSIFETTPVNAAQERERIRVAIGRMEQIIGTKNDTTRDNPRNKNMGARGNQLDCIAEATNTTVSLLLLEKEGLLRFHKTGYPQHRGLLQLKSPHNTASIIELANEAHYAVDSWFHAGGEMPEIMKVNIWKAGYSPN